MKTVAVSMMRDEDDIVDATVWQMLRQVDAVIVADNLSSDNTRRLLDGIAIESQGRLVVVDDLDPAYRQSEKITALALRARLELGADWIVPFDADEWWYSPGGRIGDVLARVDPKCNVVLADLFDHVATLDDGRDPNPVRRIKWRRRKAAPLPKVACRWAHDLVIEQGNHGARYDVWTRPHQPILVVRHFPYRSVAQLVRKVRNGAAAYKADPTIPEHFGVHWRQWGELLEQKGETAIADLFYEWYFDAEPQDNRALIYDPAP